MREPTRSDINRLDGSDLGGLDGWAYRRDRITIDFGSWGVTGLVRIADPPTAAATGP